MNNFTQFNIVENKSFFYNLAYKYSCLKKT